MVAMSFPADGRVLNFLGGANEACLHCIDFALRVPVVNPRFVPSNNLPHKLDRVRLKEIYKLLRCRA